MDKTKTDIVVALVRLVPVAVRPAHAQRALVIELDKAQHLEISQATYNAARTKFFEQLDFKVLRCDNRQALLRTDALIEKIFQAMEIPS